MSLCMRTKSVDAETLTTNYFTQLSGLATFKARQHTQRKKMLQVVRKTISYMIIFGRSCLSYSVANKVIECWTHETTKLNCSDATVKNAICDSFENGERCKTELIAENLNCFHSPDIELYPKRSDNRCVPLFSKWLCVLFAGWYCSRETRHNGIIHFISSISFVIFIVWSDPVVQWSHWTKRSHWNHAFINESVCLS